MYEYLFDYVVFIGRMEPVHTEHEAIINAAMQVSRRVIIAIGSSNQPRTIKNPWSFHERFNMISSIANNHSDWTDRWGAIALRDMYNDQDWAAQLQEKVQSRITHFGWTDKPPTVGVIGHKKDESSYYLDMFPQWQFVNHEMNQNVSSTEIRDLYFEQNIRFIKSVVPEPIFQFLELFQQTKEYERLAEEHAAVKDYKQRWSVAPFPPTFVTVDAVVMQSGHILLVKRGKIPGRGLLALPGGFVNQKERLQDAMVRELKEETKIKVPDKVLVGSIKARELFDSPNRSLRGRTITTAYLIELAPGPLPKVKGGDDAEEAMWVPLSEVKEELMFEDHFSIIRKMAGSL